MNSLYGNYWKTANYIYTKGLFSRKIVGLYFLSIWSQLVRCIQSPLLTKWHVKPIFPVVIKWQLAFREDAFKRCMKKLQFRMLAESIIEWERIWIKVTCLVLWNIHNEKLPTQLLNWNIITSPFYKKVWRARMEVDTWAKKFPLHIKKISRL